MFIRVHVKANSLLWVSFLKTIHLAYMKLGLSLASRLTNSARLAS